MSNARFDLVSYFPHEITLEIATYLNMRDLASAKRVSKHWRAALDGSLLIIAYFKNNPHFFVEKLSHLLMKLTADKFPTSALQDICSLKYADPGVQCAASYCYTINFLDEACEKIKNTHLTSGELRNKFKLLFIFIISNKKQYHFLFNEVSRQLNVSPEKLQGHIRFTLINTFKFTNEFLMYISNPLFQHRLFTQIQSLVYFSNNDFKIHCEVIQKELDNDQQAVETISKNIIHSAISGLSLYNPITFFFNNFGEKRKQGFLAFFSNAAETDQSKLVMLYLLLTEKNGKELKNRVLTVMTVIPKFNLNLLRHFLIHNLHFTSDFLERLTDKISLFRKIDAQGNHTYPNFTERYRQLDNNSTTPQSKRF